MVIKLAKRDAVRLAGLLAGVDGVEFEPHDEGIAVIAYRGGVRVGAAALVDGVDVEDDLLAMRGQILLIVAGGGASRRRVVASDAILVLDVRVKPPQPTPARRHDAVFDQPPSVWPKASETLMRFVAPIIEGQKLPIEMLSAALTFAASIWSAVALADFGGDPDPIRVLRESIKDAPASTATVVEILIARKRSHFGGDPRAFVVDDVRRGRGGKLVVIVSATIPVGLATGR